MTTLLENDVDWTLSDAAIAANPVQVTSNATLLDHHLAAPLASLSVIISKIASDPIHNLSAMDLHHLW
ncbi:unnamed protein product [Peronospora farinosa]|uniref:Uncharacterized protein n=1 Tax=Peronospora farinosa TaxID=134698 RepID=A0ABN8CJQ6_9STRA|nr:unnamed protein product [Peronospora farinosa]